MAPTSVPGAILEIHTSDPNHLYFDLMQQDRFTIEEEDEHLNNSTSQ